MSSFSRLVERQILRAQARGELTGLDGEGAPLPDRAGDAFVDPGVAAGFHIMAQAGVVPEEIELARKIDALHADLARTKDPEDRKDMMRRLADLDVRRNIAREARKRFLAP